MAGRGGFLLVVLLLWTGLLVTGAPPARAESPITLDLGLDLGDDGILQVTMTADVPAGSTATSQFPLEIAVEGNRTQRFSVSDISTDNGATATVNGDSLSLSLPAGTSTIRFAASGTVADGPDLQQFTWVAAAAWSEPIATLRGTFSSPAASPDSPICAYGEIGVRRLCSLTQTDHTGGTVRFQNNDLVAGNVVVFSVLLPAGTVPATADFTPTVAGGGQSPAAGNRAGLLTLVAAAVLAGLVVAAAWWRRRSDQIALLSTAGQSDLFATNSGPGGFVSPDGVLPGQIGSVVNGRSRPADIGATVLDLAVRNYLWIAEALDGGSNPDFQISRRADLDAGVTAYERDLVDALLPGGRQSVLVSELTSAPMPVNLRRTTTDLEQSVAGRGWIRQWRNVQIAGFVLLGIGAVAAVTLAALGHSPLFGVAAAVLGGGIAAAALLAPRRTRRGSALTAALGGMRQYVSTLDPAAIDASAQPILFERALPYAHAVGHLRAWLDRWNYAGPGPVEWYHSPTDDGPQLARLPLFAAILDGIAAQSQAAEQR
ncbi:hypothetical protein MARA_02690 (plasmid) [Mycolicibacterium arabiense]|uniref:Predicted membrane protein YciQ-like C-terminal domain-containing protein n=1 Tax=Mycolicibacterium arabiense TaxID=1286181 RepID=A0A7I7RS78_9MYCO|nr:DUF2207 domain-containing protein [Mycolicibacterium arabiense]MCV7372145.1 DUF2207 domain-containing protein [Mycolicibacterium arabiense]BBY46839.1 hypothetical protein MARA_02690 [Mycolicibacterium arabiense]